MERHGRPPAVLLTTTTSITVRSFLVPLAQAARARGWTVGVATNGDLPDGVADRVHPLPWQRSPTSPRNAVAWWRLRAALHGYDLVHCHTPVASWVTRLAAASRRRPPAVVYTAHGLHVHPGGGAVANAVYGTLERAAARWTDRIVVINAADRRTAATLGYRSEQVVAIPGIGVPLSRVRAAAAAAPPRDSVLPATVPADAPVVAVVAELTANKQHDVAVEALARLRDRRAHLVCAGDGPTRGRVAALAAQRGVADRVHLLGHRDDVPAVLRHSDVALLCSAREGLPVSLIEAMALGVPCVGSDIRGIRDLLGDGAGLRFPAGDAAACARALDAVLADPAAAAAVARTAAGRVAALDVDAVVPRYLDLYEQACAGRSRPAALRSL